jgi:hypothetical protein
MRGRRVAQRRAREARHVHRHGDRPGTNERRPDRRDRERRARMGARRAGPTNARPPYVPVPFSALAGWTAAPCCWIRSEPPRSTMPTSSAAPCSRTSGNGSGRGYFPRAARTWRAPSRASASRCDRCGALDASTLGKIEVVGRTPRLPDRMYTNRMSNLAVGSIRYGFMLGLDGWCSTTGRDAPGRGSLPRDDDDGRRGGRAGPFEEWLQTEWPELRVSCTSVTEQWASSRSADPGARMSSRVSGRCGPRRRSVPVDDLAGGNGGGRALPRMPRQLPRRALIRAPRLLVARRPRVGCGVAAGAARTGPRRCTSSARRRVRDRRTGDGRHGHADDLGMGGS